MKPEEVNDWLDAVAKQLPVFDVVGRKQSYITGHELVLCGHKTWEGEFIQPNKMYTLWVPLAKAELDNKVPRYKILDHSTKLKTLWKLHGLNGIYHYLRSYLTDEQIQEVKKMFMTVQKSAA